MEKWFGIIVKLNVSGGSMDIKKTISVIRKICYQDIYKSYWNTIDYAVKCLEKQIPKKVIYHGGNYDCPNCDKPAMTVSARKKDFCDFCGQKLEWN